MEDEEKFLSDKLLSARGEVSRIEKEKSAIEVKLRSARHYLEKVNQACIDYMQGNGLIESSEFRIKKTKVVDIEDIDAVPDDYIRTKITREPNKLKILAEKPEGNWYVMRENAHIQFVEGE